MRPLVLVHGFMGGSDQWVFQGALGEDRELIALDLPGFGRNAGMTPISTIGGFANWVLETVGSEEFDLLGHSMGGMIVQEIVRLAPRRVGRLVLYGTGAEGNLPGRFEPIETSILRASSDGAAVTARRISATWFLKNEAASAYQTCAEIAQRSTLPAIIAGLNAMREWSGTNHLPLIDTQTLVLWGDCDRTYNWQQVETLWKEIPNCNLAVIPQCAHAVHMEEPGLFNQLITNFLDRE